MTASDEKDSAPSKSLAGKKRLPAEADSSMQSDIMVYFLWAVPQTVYFDINKYISF